MKLKEVKEYLVKHKEVILIVAGTTILGIVGYKVFIPAPTKFKMPTLTPTIDRIKDFNIGVGDMTAAWDECGYTNLIIDDIPIEDLGKFGDGIKNAIPDAKVISAMFGHKIVK